LFALLAVRTSEDDRAAMWVFGALAVVGLVALFVVLSAVIDRQPRPIHVVAVERAGEQTAAYVASYLLPFVTATFFHWQDWVVFAGFLFFIGLVYIQSEMLYLNPLLALIGYRIWRVRYRTAGQAAAGALESQLVLIAAARRVEVGRDLSVSRLGDEIAVAR
jgi:hypothetical protein